MIAKRNRMLRCLDTAVWVVLLMGLLVNTARAVQVQDLVRLKGSESSKLVGMGLVVGLKGTGDGGRFLPAMRPLAAVVQRFIDPSVVADELKDAKNVALVALTAKIPGYGVREGDTVDVNVSAVGPAKSLEGGRLFMIPMTGPLPKSPVYAFAEGDLTIENLDLPTVAVVKDGAQLVRDVTATFIEDNKITLVLDEPNASWSTANNLANLINGILSPDGPKIATAKNQKNIVVQVPDYDLADPASFISQILQSYVDPSQIATGARIVINQRTGTIIVSGDVQISPVIISHKGLTITTVTPPLQVSAQNPSVQEQDFVPVDPEGRGGARLNDLLGAFNQLKVPAEDRIAILKEIHRSGKLHAQLIIE